LVIVGGGGYTLRNVPRCWVYEIGLILGEDLANGKHLKMIFIFKKLKRDATK